MDISNWIIGIEKSPPVINHDIEELILVLGIFVFIFKINLNVINDIFIIMFITCLKVIIKHEKIKIITKLIKIVLSLFITYNVSNIIMAIEITHDNLSIFFS